MSDYLAQPVQQRVLTGPLAEAFNELERVVEPSIQLRMSGLTYVDDGRLLRYEQKTNAFLDALEGWIEHQIRERSSRSESNVVSGLTESARAVVAKQQALVMMELRDQVKALTQRIETLEAKEELTHGLAVDLKSLLTDRSAPIQYDRGPGNRS